MLDEYWVAAKFIFVNVQNSVEIVRKTWIGLASLRCCVCEVCCSPHAGELNTNHYVIETLSIRFINVNTAYVVFEGLQRHAVQNVTLTQRNKSNND